jgi:hypothetical protein
MVYDYLRIYDQILTPQSSVPEFLADQTQRAAQAAD